MSRLSLTTTDDPVPIADLTFHHASWTVGYVSRRAPLATTAKRIASGRYKGMHRAFFASWQSTRYRIVRYYTAKES